MGARRFSLGNGATADEINQVIERLVVSSLGLMSSPTKSNDGIMIRMLLSRVCAGASPDRGRLLLCMGL